jgi:hypothetical protein
LKELRKKKELMKAKPPPSEEGKPPRRLCYVATDNCEFKRPLELFVFSTLARMSSGIRFNKLLGYVGCGKATLARTLKRLQFLGVAENVDNKWRAIEPPLDWFVAIKQKLPGWRNGLLYFDVPPVELPLTDALILGRIANLAATYKAAGTSISVAGLASSVKVSQRTAFRAIERLIEINLLDCVIHRGERGKR